MLGDAAESEWGHADIIGEKLSREKARQHPWKSTAFLGSKVQVHVPDPETPPRIQAPADGDLAVLLTKPWSKVAFEEYAVARGFL